MYNPINSICENTSRGQAYMTESLIAIILLSTVLVSASTTIGVTESAIGVDEKQTQTDIESDLEKTNELTLSNGELKASLLNWDSENHRYNDYTTYQTTEGLYLDYSDDDFGNRLKNLSRRYGNDVDFAVEVIPANTTISKSSDLEGVEPAGEVPVSTNSTATTYTVVSERYMTIYADDRLRSDPEVYTTIQTTALPDSNKKTVKQTYKDEIEDENRDPEDVYFPFKPRKAYNEIDDGEVWNTYRVRVIAWF